ncbi:MAG: hypothetical protein DRP52_01500 [Planctomycetota bacterium]|nr:MAG: hypothetical protein DRP52_01500 [Planctomycetota bacterium]
MNGIFRGFKLIVVLAILVGVVGYALGPARMYGYLFSKELVATIADIRSFGGSDSENSKSETFAIELHTDSDEIQIATSCEKVWAVVAKGDCVRVKLYPAAPWTSSDGSWINAKLVNKIKKPK